MLAHVSGKLDETKTNAMRALDRRGIKYEAIYYSPDIKTAQGVADAVDVQPNLVYKTLVMERPDGRGLLAMIPGDREVGLSQFARSIGAKSVRLAAKRDAERLTGLRTGGIGALALLDKRFDVYIDAGALDHEFIYVNGGRRGLNLRVRPRDLIDVTGAEAIDTDGQDTAGGLGTVT